MVVRMNFHPDDFLSLIEEVEGQGGAHLASESCKPTSFRLNQPIDPDRPDGKMHSVVFKTTGCHRRAKFLVPRLPEAYFMDGNHVDAVITDVDRHGVRIEYPANEADFDFDDSENPMALAKDGEPLMAKVCAVDDAMGLWPRFQDAMHTGESFQE